MVSKKITWQELAEHTTDDKGIWIAIDDTVYDITKFMNRHPGGTEYLYLAAGRDCTDLFNSYHPFSDNPRKILEKYAIGKLITRQYPRFKPDSGFYRTVSQRVKQYFDDNNIDPKDPIGATWRMSLMCVFYISSYFGVFSTYFDGFFGSAESNLMWWIQRIIFSVLLGWSQVMFLLHVMHDSSHAAVGHTETAWKIGGRMFSETIVGSNMLCWQNQHVIGHHVYTSLYNIDPDVPLAANGDIRLILPQQQTSWVYKYQHIYLMFLYCFLALKSRAQDLVCYITLKNGPITINPITPVQWIRLFVSKFIHIALRFLIPMYVFDMSFGLTFGLYIFAELVAGGYLAFNFQVSHVSDLAVIPVAKAIPASQCFPVNDQIKPTKDGMANVVDFNIDTSKFGKENLEESNKHCRNLRGVDEATQEELVFDVEWAHLQTNTSVDYAHDSPFCTFMCGALNYQTIHHLFPSVSQYHYPKIAKIVQKTCKEFNVRYNYIGTFAEAVDGHFRFLKKMSDKALPVEVPGFE